MKSKNIVMLALCAFIALLLASCGTKVDASAGAPSATAPPPAVVEHEGGGELLKVDHPGQFPIATAVPHRAYDELAVTGQVQPDVSRTVPVVSLASGRVIEVNARLGDSVTKGQLLMKIHSNDISQAFSDYRKAVVNEQLAKTQLDRAKTLYEKGAVAQKDLQSAQNAEDNAQVDLQTTAEHLKVLGVDPSHPEATVDIFAPVSGVITDQQVTVGAGVQALTAPSPFTISDLSNVWIVCDVYENDLPKVHPGEFADIRLNAYPDKVWQARINTILPVLDPNLRTAKVRLELQNSGIFRLGMFVTATFRGGTLEMNSAVPAAAILHLHDRDWVYVPAENDGFRRVEVTGGKMLPDNMQEITSGVKPGDKVVANALVFQNTVEQ